MPRAVLDPNVLVSALISPSGVSATLFAELRAGAFELVTSPVLLTELREVLGRDNFRRYVTEEEAEAFTQLVRRESIVVDDPQPSASPVGEDPGDEYLIALARTGSADVLVSGDAHLIRLRPTIRVLTPREFLDSLEI